MDKKLLRVKETPTVAIPLKHSGEEKLYCIGNFAIAEYSDGSRHKVLTQDDAGVLTSGGIFVEVDADYSPGEGEEIREINWQSLNSFDVFETSVARFKRIDVIRSSF